MKCEKAPVRKVCFAACLIAFVAPILGGCTFKLIYVLIVLYGYVCAAALFPNYRYHTMSDLSSLSYRELQKLCKQEGIDATGSRSVLEVPLHTHARC